jgi:hypothetical protein
MYIYMSVLCTCVAQRRQPISQSANLGFDVGFSTVQRADDIEANTEPLTLYGVCYIIIIILFIRIIIHTRDPISVADISNVYCWYVFSQSAPRQTVVYLIFLSICMIHLYLIRYLTNILIDIQLLVWIIIVQTFFCLINSLGLFCPYIFWSQNI